MSTSQRDYQRSFYDSHFAKREAAVREQLAHPLFRSFNDRVADTALRFAPSRPPGEPLRIFEPGCGEGLVASALARVAESRGVPITYLGSDLSEAGLDLARQSAAGEFRVGDAEQVTAALPDGSHDLVVAKNLLHHLDDPSAFLRQVRRVLSPEGRMVAFEPLLGCPQFLLFNLLAFRRERHYFEGQRRNRGAIEAAGLRVVTSRRFSWLPYELAFVIRPGVFRRLFSTNDPRRIARVSELDDRLTRRLPWLACYMVWVAERS